MEGKEEKGEGGKGLKKICTGEHCIQPKILKHILQRFVPQPEAAAFIRESGHGRSFKHATNSRNTRRMRSSTFSDGSRNLTSYVPTSSEQRDASIHQQNTDSGMKTACR